MKPTALILLTAAALATGCSASAPGQATAGFSATDASSSDIDLSRFADDPCRLLTIDQLDTQDEFQAPKESDGYLGPTCAWDPKDIKRPSYQVALSTRGRTIETLKAKSKAKEEKTFRETTVGGLPAFVHDFGDGRGDCETVVRTSSKDAVAVSVSGHFPGNPEYEKMCDISEKLAGLVVEKLKG